MQIKKIVVSLTLLSLLAVPVLAFAQPQGEIGSLEDFVSKIKTVVWTIFGIIALISFVIAGVLFLSAAGNPEKIAAARNAFLWGVAGVVVGILAFSIVSIIENAL